MTILIDDCFALIGWKVIANHNRNPIASVIKPFSRAVGVKVKSRFLRPAVTRVPPTVECCGVTLLV